MRAAGRVTCAVLAYTVFAALGPRRGIDLVLFQTVGRQLTGGVGLHLYALDPLAQIGPVALLIDRALDLASGGHLLVAMTVIAAVLLAVCVALVPGRGGWLGGVVLAWPWARAVPATAHLEDLLALTAAVAALRAVRGGRPTLAGLLLAVAAGCKPWALLAAGLLLFAPSWAARLRAAGVLVAAESVLWLPFVLADHRTVGALAGFRIGGQPGSLPALLGADPSWLRPAQLALALALAWAAWRRGAWWAVLAAAGAARLLLDPGTYGYYAVEIVLGAYVADRATRWLPVGTVLAAVGLLALPLDYGWRAGTCAAVVAVAVAASPPAGLAARAATTAPMTSSAG